MAPGPTFMMNKGKKAIVRFVNHADRADAIHLHGSYSMSNPSRSPEKFSACEYTNMHEGRAPFDGWAEDTNEPGQQTRKLVPGLLSM